MDRVEDYVSSREEVEGTLKSFQEMISWVALAPYARHPGRERAQSRLPLGAAGCSADEGVAVASATLSMRALSRRWPNISDSRAELTGGL